MSFCFNTLFLGVLVAVGGYSTAARCGFWKPLSRHPPTVHSGRYIVASYNYFLLRKCNTVNFVIVNHERNQRSGKLTVKGEKCSASE